MTVRSLPPISGGEVWCLCRPRRSPKGSLTLNGFGYQGIHLTAKMNGMVKGEPGLQVDDLEQDKDPAQFKVESDYFSKCILSKTTPVPSGEEGLRDMALMRKIYESAARNNKG